MSIKLREIGGRNNGRILTFTKQSQLDVALKNIVRARFLVAKPITVETEENDEQSCHVQIGNDKVNFAVIKRTGEDQVEGW